MSASSLSRGTSATHAERLGRYRRGLAAEWLAALLLLAKGYRILARRQRTPWGEIDLVAARGKRLAFVEVKRRATAEEAEAALTPVGLGRLARAAAGWVDRHPRWREHEQGLDVVLVVPGAWPRHLTNAFIPTIGRPGRRGR
jgi:putative endonuclease